MARYAYVCVDCEEPSDRYFEMGKAPAEVACMVCAKTAKRLYSFHFSEDRSRHFRNTVDGTDFSYSLGRRMPDNRNERNKAYAQLGAEPVTPGTMPQSWKENTEYAEHVRNGGERDTFKNIDISGGEKVIDQLRKSNVRIPS